MNVIQSSLVGSRIGKHYLEHGEFVSAALKTLEVLPARALNDPNRLCRLHTTRRAISQNLGKTLPMESELTNALTLELCNVDRDIRRHDHAREFNLPTIHPEFLSWKTRGGLPGFSIFSVDCDTMTMSYDCPLDPIVELLSMSGPVDWSKLTEIEERQRNETSSRLVINPKIPPIMSEHYLDEDLRVSLAALCEERRLRKIELTAKYGGVMDDSARTKIRTYLDAPAGSPRFDQIFIVCEAPADSWTITGIPIGDPIVIGVAHDLLWRIDAFDLTPTEKFVSELYVDSAEKRHN